MMMGYASSSSPHIISGAISALSMLVYKEPKVSLSIPELVPSITTLLLGKAVEVVKSALGFVKVLVSCLEANDLHGLLPEIVDAVLPWSSISRHHFREKVTVILEIIIRKCGPGAVESITPGQYRSFLRIVLQNRHGKNNAKEKQSDDATQQAPNSSSNGRTDQLQKDSGDKESGRKKRGRFDRSSSGPGKSGREQNGFRGGGGFNKRNRSSEEDSSRPQKKMKHTRGDDWKGNKGFKGTNKGNHQKTNRKFKGKNR